jgi:hypothetical protein
VVAVSLLLVLYLKVLNNTRPKCIAGKKTTLLYMSALHAFSKPWSAWQQRQLSYLAEYTTEIWHIAGNQNMVANALSRLPVASEGEPGSDT